MAEKVTKKEAEEAITAWKVQKRREREAKAALAAAEAVIAAYAREHITEFSNDQLSMENGIIALQAGPAKPLKEGKPLTTAGRLALARALPEAYVKMNCDFSLLFETENKVVREILKSQGICVVREDRYVVR